MINHEDLVIVGNGAVSKSLQFYLNSQIIERRTNVTNLKLSRIISLIVAAPSAKKHYANSNPEADAEECYNLIRTVNKLLNKYDVKNFIAISTIDVYEPDASFCNNENYFSPLNKLSVYGANRAWLEKNFLDLGASLTRLPTVFGNTMEKGIIFDLINNNVEFLPNKKSSFQFFNLKKLHKVISLQIKNKIKILNIAPPPITLEELLNFDCLKHFLEHENLSAQFDYNMKTNYENLLISLDEKAFVKDALISDIRNFLLKETALK